MPEAAGCGGWLGGKEAGAAGVIPTAVAVVSVQPGYLVGRAVIIQVGLSADLWPSVLLVRRVPWLMRLGIRVVGSV